MSDAEGGGPTQTQHETICLTHAEMCPQSGELEEAQRLLDTPARECDLCHDSVRAKKESFEARNQWSFK